MGATSTPVAKNNKDHNLFCSQGSFCHHERGVGLTSTRRSSYRGLKEPACPVRQTNIICTLGLRSQRAACGVEMDGWLFFVSVGEAPFFQLPPFS